MAVGFVRALRFARGWRDGERGVLAQELEVRRGDRSVPASLYRPTGADGPLPGWVVLHGITRPGRMHPVLQRMVRALARSGATVLVPEVPEWRELHLAPEQAQDTASAGIRTLVRHAGVAPGGVVRS